MKSKMLPRSEYNNPFHSLETNFQIALGAIEFRDKTIENLRQQIEALRKSLLNYGMAETSIDNVQYAHLKENNEFI